LNIFQLVFSHLDYDRRERNLWGSGAERDRDDAGPRCVGVNFEKLHRFRRVILSIRDHSDYAENLRVDLSVSLSECSSNLALVQHV
jgi:hypothetical protein